MTHADALNLNLSNERNRLAMAKTEGERALRAVWISQLEKELTREIEFCKKYEISDDKLLAELMS